jgi:hypothetical protein
MDGGRIVEREGHSADCTEPWTNEGLAGKNKLISHAYNVSYHMHYD